VVGANVPITLAGKTYRLAELPRRANREWQDHLTSEVRRAMAASGPLETADEVIDALAASGDLMLDLLLSYDAAAETAWPDRKPVLPEREWLDDRATDRECYEAIKKVTGVSFPFGADVLRIIPEVRPMLLQAVSKGVAAAAVALAVTSSRSTSSAPPNTAGDRTTSKPASRTRSSSRTSTRRSTAATEKQPTTSTG
jgi:hypothetical protein